MKTNRIPPATLRLCAGLLLAGALALETAHSGPTNTPPERMTYQGFLTDANGAPLATNAPQNFNVLFRVFREQNGGLPMWAEQQTLTVDRGNFSALLGEGTAVGTNGPLSSLFSGADASDRYVEMTVQGIGSSGADVTILPRLRLLPSAYAFSALSAVRASTLVGNNGSNLVSSSGNTVVVAGPVSAPQFTGSGAGLTGVAKLEGGNFFSGVQYITSGKLGIGVDTNSFTRAPLDVAATNFYGVSAVIDGNVGIGTGGIETTAKLQVAGDVKLGSSGQYFATSGNENLRIVRGTVYGNGSIFRGQGFTVTRESVGVQLITFTPPFSDYPTPVVTFESSTVGATARAILTGGYNVRIYTYVGTTPSDQLYNFIAVGPR